MCFDETDNQWNLLRKMKHDMVNTYILELAYLENGQYEKLRELYINAIGKLKNRTNVITTGNLAIDSVINYKLEKIKDLHADIKHEIKVCDEIYINGSDLNILLGALFDNAVEALEKIEESRRSLDFKLITDNTAMLFEIKNTFDGTVYRNNNMEIVTSKNDGVNHGIGLASVREIVKRYNGKLQIDIHKNVFWVKTLLYMEV